MKLQAALDSMPQVDEKGYFEAFEGQTVLQRVKTVFGCSRWVICLPASFLWTTKTRE